MTYKVLTLADLRHVQMPPIPGWEFSTVPPDYGPSSLAQLPLHRGIANSSIGKFIKESQPHFVVVICEGCSERRLERFGLIPGPKYITWSTDSYRHTIRFTASDLHLTALADAASRSDDHFLPLFGGPNSLMPLAQRRVRCGIVCRPYALGDGYRECELARVKEVVPDLVREATLEPHEYDVRIRDFAFGLNVPIYPDGLPNFRSFELGRAGVMPICSSLQRTLLESLFGEHIRLFDQVDEVPRLLTMPYDAPALKSFYDQHHSYEARLRQLFRQFFDLEL